MAVIALLGSGEFEPWARPVDAWCVEAASAPSERILVVPTASAPEGEEVFTGWAEMGLAHYRAMGLAPEVLGLRTRDDASRADLVDAVEGARLIFFSGGNPGYLAETLSGTPFWEAVLAAVAGGTAIGGCSAGAVFLGTLAPFVDGAEVARWVPGLAMLPRAFVIPHYDMLDTYAPGLRTAILRMRPTDSIAVGIDENTALYGSDGAWQVAGSGSAWIGEGSGDLTPHRDGERLAVRLDAALS